MRWLTVKCLCTIVKRQAAEIIQFGVACSVGSEKVVHGIRSCLDSHEDFYFLKVDFKKAINVLEAFLHKCSQHFPGSLPWVAC